MRNFLFITSFVFALGANAANLDSLYEVAVDKKLPKPKRAEAMLQWSIHSGDTTAESEELLNTAEKYAREGENYKLLATIIEHHYNWYKAKGQMTSAFRKNLEHIELATETVDTPLLARAYWLQGLLYVEIDALVMAIESEKKALHMFKELKDQNNIAYHSYLIGWYSFNNGNYKQALDYFLFAFDLHKKLKADNSTLSEDAGWIGNAYSGLFEYRDAFKYRFMSLAYAKKTTDDYVIGEAYRYLGNVHHKLGNYDSAIYYHSTALEHYNKTGFISRQGLMMHELAKSYFEMKNYAEAERVMNTLNENLPRYDFFVNQLFEELAGDIYAKSGDAKKALQFYIRYMSRRDSMEEMMQKNNILTSNIKFQFENELEKLRQAKTKKDREQLHEADARSAFWRLIIIVSVLVLVFIGYAVWSTRKRKHLQQELNRLKT